MPPRKNKAQEPETPEWILSKVPCLTEEFREAGILHKSDGPAIITRDASSGVVLLEKHYRHGRLHRDDDMPAVTLFHHERYSIRRNPNVYEVLQKTEWWFKNGRYHRDNEPAQITTDLKTGLRLMEKWYQDGLQHRPEGGPTLIWRDLVSGVAVETAWHQWGMRSRTDGPAYVVRDKDTGIATSERWELAGQTHRLDGPAQIWRDKDTGQLRGVYYFINGQEVPASAIKPKLT